MIEKIIKAAFNKNQKFFMGSDSAPHIKSKESACGCAGIFNTINSIQIMFYFDHQ